MADGIEYKEQPRYPGLSDIANMTHNGLIIQMVDEWEKTTSILKDMPARPSTDMLEDVSGIVDSLPKGEWTGLDDGVKASKGGFKQRVEQMGLYEDWSEYNEKHQKVVGADYDAARWELDQLHIQALGQEVERCLLYGNPYGGTENAEHEFLGFMPRLNHLTDYHGTLKTPIKDDQTGLTITKSPYVVLDAGGKASGTSQLCSILMVAHGPLGASLIYPKNATNGMTYDTFGFENVTDGNGGNKRIARSHFMWMGGLRIPNRRTVVRIANIDITDANLVKTLNTLMLQGFRSIPQAYRNSVAMYANTDVIVAYNSGLNNAVVPNTYANAGLSNPQSNVSIGGFAVTQCDTMVNDEDQIA